MSPVQSLNILDILLSHFDGKLWLTLRSFLGKKLWCIYKLSELDIYKYIYKYVEWTRHVQLYINICRANVTYC